MLKPLGKENYFLRLIQDGNFKIMQERLVELEYTNG